MCALKSAMSQVMSNTSVKVSSSTKTWKGGGVFPPIFVICFFWGGRGVGATDPPAPPAPPPI